MLWNEALSHWLCVALTFQSGPYRNSRKEPDYFIRPDSRFLPTIAVESGWSESLPLLHDDMNLLLVGGRPDIKAVVILQWTLRSAGVGGVVQLWMRQRGQAIPVMVQEEVWSRFFINDNAG